MMVGNKKKLIQYLLDQEDDKQFEVKEFKEKKTNSQNKMCWRYITEIGNVLKISKEEVYLDMLKHYGQSEIVSIASSISPIGYFKYYEEIGKGVINDKEFTHYKIFKGSSEFDTKEMSILISGILQECDNLGIEHITKQEIEILKLI